MKIILLQDEKKLGKKGDIIEASEGYARNYILPKKIGVEASSKNLNDLKLHKANEEKVAQENLDAAKALAMCLSSLQFTQEFVDRANQQSNEQLAGVLQRSAENEALMNAYLRKCGY